MKIFKNKKILILICTILVIILFFIIGFIISTKNRSIVVSTSNNNKTIRINLEKPTKKIIKVENNSINKNNMELAFVNVDLNMYSEFIVYNLYENDKLIHKGIIHDDIDNVIGDISVRDDNEKNYTVTFESVSKKKGIVEVNGDFVLREKQVKQKSYLSNYHGDYSLNTYALILANGRKLNSSEYDENIKAIKIAKEMNNNYLKDEYIVSTKDSSKPIYMWYEDGVLYLYSENVISIVQYSNHLFSYMENLTDIDDLKYLDISKADELSAMFSYDKSLANIKALSYWDTSNIKRMNYMFSNCELLTDISALAAFDTSRVTDMSSMFYWTGINNTDALRFFDTTSVESINSMFSESDVSDISGLANWNTESLEKMFEAFNSSKVVDLSPLKDWNTNNLKNIGYAFGNTYIENVDALAKWNVKKVINMGLIFYGCLKLNDISGLSNWDTSSLEKMDLSFSYTDINNVDALSEWDTSNLNDISKMFDNARKLKDINGLKNFKVDKVTSFEGLFAYTSFTDTSPLINWNTGNVINMKNVFNHSKIKNTKGIDNWNLTNVNNFEGIFNYCSSKPKWKGTFSGNGTFVK